jgi:hypothetical protein
MTANRWWVRAAARWLARVDGVSGQLRLAMLGLTGLSTATLSLQQYGFGHLAPAFVTVVLAGTVAFAYFFTEGGVWNQMARDRQDLSNNYSDPDMRIRSELLARALVAAEEGRRLTDEEQQAVGDELDAAYVEFRDGIDVRADGGDQDD